MKMFLTAIALAFATPAAAQSAPADPHAGHSAAQHEAAMQDHSAHAGHGRAATAEDHSKHGGCCDKQNGKAMPCCDKAKTADKKMDCCDKAAAAAPPSDAHAGHGPGHQ